MNNSIANNHLSVDSLTGGRGGDTTFRLVDGEMSHVNETEASIIDALGKVGEEAVKKRGSGTINPYTGNKEYMIASLVMAGLTVYEQKKALDLERKGARQQLGLLDKQLEASRASEEARGKQRLAEINVTDADFATKSQAIGESVTDAKKNLQDTFEKTGLKTTSAESKGEKSLWKAFEKSSTGIQKEHAVNMGKVEGNFEADMSRIQADRRRMESEKKIHTAVSEKKMFGIL